MAWEAVYGIDIMKTSYLPLFLCCFMASSIEAFSQDNNIIRDTLPAAIKEDVRGGQKNLNERLIVLKDFSVMATPTGEADFVKFVQTLPGVASGSDGSSSYYVRGGNLGGNLQTLDGVPIYAASHLIGLTTPYSAEIVSSADFQVGGFTSEEGNLSSSHIRLHSKDGSFSDFSAKAEVSNFLLGGHVNTPLVKDKLSLITSLRVSPAQFEYSAISGLLDKDVVYFSNARATVGDAYAKLKYRSGQRSSISLSVLGSIDSYGFREGDSSEDSMSWNNLMAILQYNQRIGRRHSLLVSGSFNHYGSEQGMMKKLRDTSNDLLIRSQLDETMLHGMFKSEFGKSWKAQYGLKLRNAWFNPGSARVLESTGPFSKSSSPLTDNKISTMTGTLHGQLEVGDYSRSMARLAARFNYNDATGFLPEVSFLLRVRLFKFLGVEFTADKLGQYYHTLEGIPLGWSLEMIVPPSEKFKPEKTDQLYAGIYTDFRSHHVSLGAYSKKMKNLVYFSDATKLFDSALAGWENNIDVGLGASKGVEFLYENTGEPVNWRVAYTLSKTDRTFEELNYGISFPAKYDRRHVLNVSVGTILKKGEKADITAAALFTYQSGHWETVPAGYFKEENSMFGTVIEQSFYTSLNNYRMPPYIRLDLSAAIEFKKTRRPQSLNVGIYNVLNRHNPFALSYDPGTDTWKKLSLLPIMPSLKYTVSF